MIYFYHFPPFSPIHFTQTCCDSATTRIVTAIVKETRSLLVYPNQRGTFDLTSIVSWGTKYCVLRPGFMTSVASSHILNKTTLTYKTPLTYWIRLFHEQLCHQHNQQYRICSCILVELNKENKPSNFRTIFLYFLITFLNVAKRFNSIL